MAKTSGKSNVKQIQKIAQKKRSKKSPLSVTVTTKAGPAKALSSKAASAKAALRKAASSKAVSAEEDSAKKRSKLHPIKSSQATPSSNKKRTIVSENYTNCNQKAELLEKCRSFVTASSNLAKKKLRRNFF